MAPARLGANGWQDTMQTSCWKLDVTLAVSEKTATLGAPGGSSLFRSFPAQRIVPFRSPWRATLPGKANLSRKEDVGPNVSGCGETPRKA